MAEENKEKTVSEEKVDNVEKQIVKEVRKKPGFDKVAWKPKTSIGTKVKNDDIIFVVSDGVYDNFDPEELGIPPRKLGIDADEWEPHDPDHAKKMDEFMKVALAEVVRDCQTLDEMNEKVNEFIQEASFNCTVANITLFAPPKDKREYSGKLDDANRVFARVKVK